VKKNGTECGRTVEENFGEGFDDTLSTIDIRAPKKSAKAKLFVYLPLFHHLHTVDI